MNQTVRRRVMAIKKRDIDPLAEPEQAPVGAVDQLMRGGIGNLAEEQARRPEQRDPVPYPEAAQPGEACHRGNLALCHNAPGVMGGFAELMRIPAGVAVKLPATLSVADGALIEPLAVGLYATRMARIQPGDRVLVLGAGSVALCAIYWARRLGAGRIVAMSRSRSPVNRT